MKGNQVVIPATIQAKILQKLHIVHFGVVKMKNLARGHCWWPHIGLDIEKLAKNCRECCLFRNNPVQVKKHIWEPATVPFERVHMDFAGPFKGNLFFLLIDSYTKWPEIYITKNMLASTVISTCCKIFAIFGLPRVVVSDNGTNFKSNEFQNFLQKNCIYFKFSAPYNPSSNGQAEKYVQTLKNALNKMCNTSKNIEKSLLQLLSQYRIMPHVSTGKTPSELMFNRKVRCHLDLLKPEKEIVKNIVYTCENILKLMIELFVDIMSIMLSGNKVE